MAQEGGALQRLIHNLAKLPGIGERTAARLAFHVLRQPDEYASDLAQSLLDVKSRMRACSVCCNLSEIDPCEICEDPKRSDDIVCVVEEPRDLLAVERTHEFRGRYHILHGTLSPIDGVEVLRLDQVVHHVHRSSHQQGDQSLE